MSEAPKSAKTPNLHTTVSIIIKLVTHAIDAIARVSPPCDVTVPRATPSA